MRPPSPWSFASLRLKHHGLSTPCRSCSDIAAACVALPYVEQCTA
jgi:hypothetical protein